MLELELVVMVVSLRTEPYLLDFLLYLLLLKLLLTFLLLIEEL